MKLSLPRDGEQIHKLAQRYQYKLPFTAEAYSDVPESGTYPGGVPMENANQDAVPAYTEYEHELRPQLQTFRQVDECRLLEMRIDEWISMAELVSQNVCSRIFFAADYEEAKKLHEEWASLKNICCLPNHEHDDQIRNYFGEEVAFLFRWFSFYTRALI